MPPGTHIEIFKSEIFISTITAIFFDDLQWKIISRGQTQCGLVLSVVAVQFTNLSQNAFS